MFSFTINIEIFWILQVILLIFLYFRIHPIPLGQVYEKMEDENTACHWQTEAHRHYPVNLNVIRYVVLGMSKELGSLMPYISILYFMKDIVDRALIYSLLYYYMGLILYVYGGRTDHIFEFYHKVYVKPDILIFLKSYV